MAPPERFNETRNQQRPKKISSKKDAVLRASIRDEIAKLREAWEERPKFGLCEGQQGKTEEYSSFIEPYTDGQKTNATRIKELLKGDLKSAISALAPLRALLGSKKETQRLLGDKSTVGRICTILYVIAKKMENELRGGPENKLAFSRLSENVGWLMDVREEKNPTAKSFSANSRETAIPLLWEEVLNWCDYYFLRLTDGIANADKEKMPQLKMGFNASCRLQWSEKILEYGYHLNRVEPGHLNVLYYLTKISFTEKNWETALGYADQALQAPEGAGAVDEKEKGGNANYQYYNVLVMAAKSAAALGKGGLMAYYAEKIPSAEDEQTKFYFLCLAYFKLGRTEEAFELAHTLPGCPGLLPVFKAAIKTYSQQKNYRLLCRSVQQLLQCLEQKKEANQSPAGLTPQDLLESLQQGIEAAVITGQTMLALGWLVQLDKIKDIKTSRPDWIRLGAVLSIQADDRNTFCQFAPAYLQGEDRPFRLSYLLKKSCSAAQWQMALELIDTYGAEIGLSAEHIRFGFQAATACGDTARAEAFQKQLAPAPEEDEWNEERRKPAKRMGSVKEDSAAQQVIAPGAPSGAVSPLSAEPPAAMPPAPTPTRWTRFKHWLTGLFKGKQD